ncbi:MAG: response regulator [Methylococcales bacterium]|nr:response regulator [Methylococcales bacterium]
MSISVATKFLVVDNSESIRKVIIQKLRAFGAQRCLEAANGEEALVILKQQTIDVILSDSDISPMSGLDLLKIVRTDAKLCSVSFVMITGESSHDYLLEAIKYGVSSVLIKPYTLDVLSECIEKALKNPLKTAIPLITKDDIPEVVAKPVAPLTILAVDDSPAFLESLTNLFENEYRVQVAQNGAAALEICTSDNPPDLVLLDILMPDIDGFEVANRMREHPNSQHIPVIFVTALTNEEIRLRGLDLGAVDFVTKPIDADILKVRVKNFMRYVKLHKQLQSDRDEMLENARLRDVIENITRNDLKVPLTGIIHLIEMILESNGLNNRQIEQLRVMEEIALQAIRTINFSIELYKIETGHFELNPQPVNIDAILRRLVEISRETFHVRQLTLVIQTESETKPLISGDSALCYSLFHNLINNACEYADEKSCVTISINNENPMKITITNQGVVEHKYRDTFFEKYLDSVSMKWGGAYSAKLLAEVQRGCISLDVSDAENLTTVTVYLPKFLEQKNA